MHFESAEARRRNVMCDADHTVLTLPKDCLTKFGCCPVPENSDEKGASPRSRVILRQGLMGEGSSDGQ
jgi:hypothetical protein